MSVRILALVGSLRAGSHNRQLAEAAVKLAPEGVEIEIFEGLAELSLLQRGHRRRGHRPAAAAELREAASGADAFLLFSPEYNGTIPAVLKNAIDWPSRPYGAGAFAGKPVAVVGTAFGQYGGVWAQDEARKAVGIAGGAVLEDVKLSIPGSVVRFAETHPRRRRRAGRAGHDRHPAGRRRDQGACRGLRSPGPAARPAGLRRDVRHAMHARRRARRSCVREHDDSHGSPVPTRTPVRSRNVTGPWPWTSSPRASPSGSGARSTLRPRSSSRRGR